MHAGLDAGSVDEIKAVQENTNCCDWRCTNAPTALILIPDVLNPLHCCDCFSSICLSALICYVQLLKKKQKKTARKRKERKSERAERGQNRMPLASTFPHTFYHIKTLTSTTLMDSQRRRLKTQTRRVNSNRSIRTLAIFPNSLVRACVSE